MAGMEDEFSGGGSGNPGAETNNGACVLTIDEGFDRSLFGVEAADLDGGVSREESVLPTRGFHDV